MLSTRFVAARFLAALAPAGRLATPRSAVLPRVAALHSTRMQLSDNFGMDDSGARPPSEKQVHAHSLRLSYLLLGDARAKISPIRPNRIHNAHLLPPPLSPRTGPVCAASLSAIGY